MHLCSVKGICQGIPQSCAITQLSTAALQPLNPSDQSLAHKESKNLERVRGDAAFQASSQSARIPALSTDTFDLEQTAIAGRIQKELQCLPVDNEDFRRIMEERARKEAEKKTTSFEDGAQSTAMAPVQRGAGDSFASFIVSTLLPKHCMTTKLNGC